MSTPLPEPSTITPIALVITNDYTEGVVVDRDGNIYFSHGAKITRVTPGGEAADWCETGAPNGHKILSDGEHLVCDGDRHAVLRLAVDGAVLGNAAAGRSGDLDIRTPNDLTLDPAGGFYFSDSVPETGAVHYVAPDGSMQVVARDIDFANGVALSADRTRLYVAESLKNRILEIRLRRPGVPEGAPRVFADLPANTERPGTEFNQPDGMAFDADGRLWVAHYGMQAIHVLSPEGRLLATYDGGNRLTSNLCFAGPDFATIYTTGGEPGGLYRLDVGVPGISSLRSSSEF